MLKSVSLIAVMLARLRMPLHECIDAYKKLSKRAFTKKNLLEKVFEGKISPTDPHYDTSTLEAAILEVIERQHPSEARDLLLKDDKSAPCKA